MAALIAHQGGWDEALLFVVPIALAYLLIKVLERRGKREQDARGAEGHDENSLHREAGSQNNIP